MLSPSKLVLLSVGLLCLIIAATVAEEKAISPPPEPMQQPTISTTTTVTTATTGSATTTITTATTVSTTTTVAIDTTQFGIITLRWRTESEQDNYGFNVYRSLSEDSAFDKINTQIVRGNGTTSEPHDYIYIDRTAIKGKTYYYYLMDVDYAGNTKKFTPTINRHLPTDEEAKAEKAKESSAEKKVNLKRKK